MKTPIDWKVLFHGVDHEQYFPGCGLWGTEFTDVATGIGDSAEEAFQDALEQLAQGEWDVEPIETQQHRDVGILNKSMIAEDEENLHVYVSVKVK